VQAHPREQLRTVRIKVMLGGAAVVLAVVAFAALAGHEGDQQSLRGFATELEQSSDKLTSFENKLAKDRGQLDTVISRLGEIKTAESQIRHQQAALLQKEQATRATVHEARNKVVSLKYKIHNMKTVAFSDEMFGLSTKTGKQAQAHANLEHKAQGLEKNRVQEVVQATEHTLVKGVSHVLPKVATVTVHHGHSANNAEIIATGLRQAKEQMEQVRRQATAHADAAKIRAAAALQRKALALEAEHDATAAEKKRKADAEQHWNEKAVAKKVAANAASARKIEAPYMVRAPTSKNDVSRMQAEVLHKRAVARTPPSVVGHPLEMRVAPTHMPHKYASPHKPLTLGQAADLASRNAQTAQQMAFMRSPQFWHNQQAIHTTKRFGMMPALPLLNALDSSAADQ